MVSLSPCLMFDGVASDAIALYLKAFPHAVVIERSDYDSRDGSMSGKVRSATLSLCGCSVRIIDSPVVHGFAFTPAVSLYVEIADESELFLAYEALAERGTVLLAIDSYPHSPNYGWITDQFGVSWQLSQPDVAR